MDELNVSRMEPSELSRERAEGVDSVPLTEMWTSDQPRGNAANKETKKP
jgi:hypothetical protein